MDSDPVDLPSGARLAAWLPTALVLLALMAACILLLWLLSATRAYLATESLWTKATFNALLSLERYAEHGSSSDLQRFRGALQVPLALREARSALEQPHISLDVPAQHLIRAGVDPADAMPMCYLYRLAQTMHWAPPAVAYWVTGDAFVDRLMTVAARIPGSAQRPLSEPERVALRTLVQAQSDRFAAVQGRFGAEVSERSRLVAQWGIGATVVLTGILALAAMLYVLRARTRELCVLSALHTAHERLRLATQSDQLGIFEWRVGSPLVRFDQRVCQLYGLPCEGAWAMVDRAVLRTRVHPNDQPALRHAIEQAAQQRRLFKHRYRVAPAPSVARHLEITGLCTSTSGRLGMVGVVRDITEEVQRAWLESEARADEMAARTRSRLLSRLSHELRTPLHAILGFTHLLLEQRSELTPVQSEWLSQVDQAGRGLLRMIEDVLRIALVSGGGLAVCTTSVSVHTVLRAALGSNEVFRRTRRVGFDMQQIDPALLVHADPVLLGEAVNRLCEHVIAVAAPDARVSVHLLQQDRTVELRLELQHWSTPMSHQTSLLDEAPSSQLGFPLALVEALLAAMQGRLEVQSRPAGGAVIIVQMPQWREDQPRT